VTAEAEEAITDRGGDVSPVVVRQRVAFQHCLIDGRTAAEYEPGGVASEEITRLLANLLSVQQEHMKTGKPVRRKVA
jgi:chromosome partitioning protein